MFPSSDVWHHIKKQAVLLFNVFFRISRKSTTSMIKGVLLSLLVVAIVSSSNAEECSGTPQPYTCRHTEPQTYWSFNGGQCRRLWGCYNTSEDNVFEEEEDCQKACEAN